MNVKFTRALKVFLTVADCGNMSVAARQLHMTVSAISQQLRKLEETEINLENAALTLERGQLQGLLDDEILRRQTLAAEINDIKSKFGKNTELGKRRTDIGTPPPDIVVPLDIMIEKEPITIILVLLNLS